jgi:hypothetical protein
LGWDFGAQDLRDSLDGGLEICVPSLRFDKLIAVPSQELLHAFSPEHLGLRRREPIRANAFVQLAEFRGERMGVFEQLAAGLRLFQLRLCGLA